MRSIDRAAKAAKAGPLSEPEIQRSKSKKRPTKEEEEARAGVKRQRSSKTVAEDEEMDVTPGVHQVRRAPLHVRKGCVFTSSPGPELSAAPEHVDSTLLIRILAPRSSTRLIGPLTAQTAVSASAIDTRRISSSRRAAQ